MRINRLRASCAERAFTVAEVVVAVLVLSVLATAFYGGLSSGFEVVEGSRQDLRATQILMQRMEAIRLCTWSELSNFDFRETYDPLGATNRGAGVIYSGTVRTNAASDLPAGVSYRDRVCLVSVSLFWTNYHGNKPIVHQREMQTQVARYGLQSYVWGAIR